MTEMRTALGIPCTASWSGATQHPATDIASLYTVCCACNDILLAYNSILGAMLYNGYLLPASAFFEPFTGSVSSRVSTVKASRNCQGDCGSITGILHHQCPGLRLWGVYMIIK